MNVDKSKCSPMMQKYLETKENYPDCILFYRLGDFYEMFFDDAINVSRELELTLTGKDCGLEERAPMCGIPHHAADNYLARLVSKGYKVAICEQLEDPKATKGIVKRGVIRIVTPGTVIDSNMLEERKNNYIMCIYKSGIYYGISVADITTGEFYASQIKEVNNFPLLLDEIARFTPSEIIINTMMENSTQELSKIKERFENVYINKFKDEFFKDEYEELIKRFQIKNNKQENITDYESISLAINSINALIEYLNQTQMTTLEHINKIEIYTVSRYMALDINARRNLEITERMRDKSKKGTLLWVLDKTSTSMGGRLLRRWLNDPLVDSREINLRLEAVEELKNSIMLRGEVIESLKKVYDIERLAGKMAYGNGTPRDMITLKNSLIKLPEVKRILSNSNSELLKNIYENIDELQDIYELIEKSIVDDPPMTIKDGGIIKLGYDEEIDKLKTAQTEGKNWLVQLEADEKEKTGIKNLKVGFNKVFGYYIEISKGNIPLVKDEWNYDRKQTLVNCERFITPILKEKENIILGAEEKIIELEYRLFMEIRDEVKKYISVIQKNSKVLAEIDMIASFATVTEENSYVRPKFTEKREIVIKDGRHPVIEKVSNMEFVADKLFDDKAVIYVTGKDVVLENNTIDYDAPNTGDAYAVYADSADGLNMVDNKIFFDGKLGEDTKTIAVYAIDSDNMVVKDNIIDSTVPSVAVGYGPAPDYAPTIMSAGAIFEGCKNLTFEDNTVSVDYNQSAGYSDTLYGVKVIDGDDSKIIGNDIELNGHAYAYAVSVDGENLTISDNTIESNSDDAYAAGLAIEKDSTGNVENNDISATANDVSYGVYADDWEMGSNLTFNNNNVSAESNTAYGISVEEKGNAVKLANTPNIDKLMKQYPTTRLM